MICRLLGSLAFLAVSCFGSPIYFWVNDASGNIGEVNIATGGVTMVGNAGVILTDIAFAPDGSLYGVTMTSLYSINTCTGKATLIGSLGNGISNANALAFSPGGTLYTADYNNLYTVNPATGLANDVGPIGLGGSGGDLAFLGGKLYLSTASNQLATLNPSTGATTLVGNLDAVNIWGLGSPSNLNLYGVGGENVYSISLTSGIATFDLSWDENRQGLGVAWGGAFAPATIDPPADPPSDPPSDPTSDPISTPEPATLALFCVGVLLIALRFRLRSRSAPENVRAAGGRNAGE